mgnify:CR=1 FL=1
MSFSYNKGDWNTDTHSYENGYFTPIGESNYLTVQNNNQSNVSIIADFSHNIDAQYSMLDGYYTSDNSYDGTRVTSSEIAIKDEVTVWFWVDGQLPQSAEAGQEYTVGTCTVTIRSGTRK